MNIQPVSGIPALRYDKKLIIGDLHIGVESHLGSKGFHLVSKTWDMFDSIIDISDECNRLIVLGDIKDSVPGTSKQEYREIPDFFDRLLEHFDDVDVVRGNHDTNIEEFLSGRVRIRPASGLKIGKVGFIHGHTWPSEDVMDCDTLIMAHNHPAVMFRDGVGKISTEPCWIRGKFFEGPFERYSNLPKEFIVVPAFNRMLGGSPVNVTGERFLGPLLNSDLVDIDNARIYLLDGMNLGKREDILLTGRDRSRWKK
ncbi:MAG TPA: metallophosphoesterase [Candidatus Methanomethylophilaceae archaeon]|nr:metallophosphoesterase [Candidatus Methanomethylophilaceae archaeon]